MKKRFFTLALALFFILSITLPVCAESGDGFNSPYARLQDDAALLSSDEYNEVLSRLDELCERQSFDVVIHTTEDMDGYSSVVAYADDYYDYNGYGYGEDRDGIILVVAMNTRDLYISTCGFGITAFTDYGIDTLLDDVKGYFSDGDYYGGFCSFISEADEYITAAKNGSPYDINDGDYYGSERSGFFNFTWLMASLIMGLVCALIIVGTMKAQLKTVRPALAAGSYVRKDSIKVKSERDIYLYRNVSRTEIVRESSSGGSSTHVSSSGTTHGGGGTKF